MSDDRERAKFERHFMDAGAKLSDFKLTPDGLYNLDVVNQSWEGWKARAAMDKAEHIKQWLRAQANAEKDPKAKAAFVEAHNAIVLFARKR